ncbi:MAG: SAM-dependent methyltransferase [Alloprevotella sp.]|nr:SAM-dependent methyltransferase [Alloprevotella sp.]
MTSTDHTDQPAETAAAEPALYLIPCQISEAPLDDVLPPLNRAIVLGIRHFIVEEVRTARRFLKQLDRSIDIDALTFYPMGKHADASRFSAYLEPLRKGQSVGVISEAGCPAVADPGAVVVGIAQREGLKVVPLVGPSSILLCLMASGFNGQSFSFVGYLPIDSAERQKRLRQLESRSAQEQQTQLFIETPFRNARLFGDLLHALRPDTRLCIASGLTGQKALVRTMTMRQWKQQGLPDIGKTPTVFAIYAGK